MTLLEVLMEPFMQQAKRIGVTGDANIEGYAETTIDDFTNTELVRAISEILERRGTSFDYE